MTEVFKITHNTYDPDVSLKLEYNLDCSTRGNKYKLANRTFHYDLRKYFFLRIVNIWNSLPNLLKPPESMTMLAIASTGCKAI